ncbi:hypothetical protein LFAB_13060 [Lactiplantibacillus fabifermentans T30PCM01]|uniref:Uncharacterized protein n=1 Tax=Lactiplantibacillus fabifermentans T30PCM01 TaxID=1400520 RepID=W6T5K1_9LACO|nr:hypothetical protein LFAB_13060 [Lactiplantibacillus fabifermentans T30PCM01]
MEAAVQVVLMPVILLTFTAPTSLAIGGFGRAPK